MIARIWKGVVRRADADTYAGYIRNRASPSTPTRRATAARGCCAATRRTAPSSSPSRTGSRSDAIRAFHGDDIEAAVLYPEDERYLVGGESTVTQYEIADEVRPRSKDEIGGSSAA